MEYSSFMVLHSTLLCKACTYKDVDENEENEWISKDDGEISYILF
jgi:hypothetical protein